MIEKPARCTKYLRWVATLPCVVCGGESVAHHLIGHGKSGMGTKVSDFETFPLCGHHHTGDQGIHLLGWRRWEEIYGCQTKHVRRTTEKAKVAGWLK